MRHDVEVVATASDRACVTFTGSAATGTEPYHVDGLLNFHDASELVVVNLTSQTIVVPDVPTTTTCYLPLTMRKVRLTNAGGSIEVPPQVHARWDERVGMIQRIAEHLNAPALFVLDVPGPGEVRKRVALNQLKDEHRTAIVFVQEEGLRLEVTEGEIRKRERPMDMSDIHDCLAAVPSESAAPMFLTPPLHAHALPQYLSALIGATKVLARDRFVEHTVTLPPWARIDSTMLAYCVCSNNVVDGAHGVRCGSNSSTISFRIHGDDDKWRITLCLLGVSPSPSGNPLLDRAFLQICRGIASDFKPIECVHEMLRSTPSIKHVLQAFPDFESIWRIACDKGIQLWNEAVVAHNNSLCSTSYLPTVPLSGRPARQCSQMPVRQ